MLWQATILVSAEKNEAEIQYVLRRGSARNLVGLEVGIDLVPAPASEVVFAETDRVVAAFDLRTAAAWTALHPAVVAATTRCSPVDQQPLLEQRSMLTLEVS